MVYGTERFATDQASVARLTALLTGVLIGSQAISNLVWGFIGDIKGHKTVLVSASFILMLAALTALLASSQVWLVISFVLLGVYLAAEQVSSLNIILEFCEEQDRPTYIGLTNTLLAPLYALAPLLGAWIVTGFGYSALFTCAVVAAVVGGVALRVWVREPRANS